MISEESVQDFFDHARELRDEGRSRFDVDDVCRWSFYFIDPSLEKLKRTGEFLESCGYEFTGLLEPTDEDDDPEECFLCVERVEKHTVGTLLNRNEELYAIADRFQLEDYDGMEVGPI